MEWREEDQSIANALKELPAFRLSTERKYTMLESIQGRALQKRRIRKWKTASISALSAAAVLTVAVGLWHGHAAKLQANDLTLHDAVSGAQNIHLHLIYEAEESQTEQATPAGMKELQTVLQQRLQQAGATQSKVALQGTKFVTVDVTGPFDATRIRSLLQKEGQLQFKVANGIVVATGKDLMPNAKAVTDSHSGQPEVQLQFKDPTLFRAITKKYMGQTMEISLDGQQLMDPRIVTVISDGKVMINGIPNAKEAEIVAADLNLSPLPYPIAEVSD